MKNIKIYGFFVLSFILFLGCCKDDDDTVLLSPDVDFTYSPASPEVGEEVSFVANQNPASSKIVDWSWDFGDGGTSTEKNPVHAYSEAGDYTVVLTATDEAGVSIGVSQDITVAEVEEESFPAAIAWSFTNGTTVSRPNDGSPAPVVGDDGTIYYLESFAKENSALVAVTDMGDAAEKKWSTSVGANLRNAISMGPNGNVYTGAWLRDGMFGFNGNSGDIFWNKTTNGGVSNATTAIDSDGNVYLGTRAGGVFSWTADGTLRWNHESPDGSNFPFYSSGALSNDESTLYILMTAGEVWALSTADGTFKWDEPLAVSEGVGTSLSVDADGTVYVTTGSEVIAVTDNGNSGSVKWSYAVEGASASGVVIGPDGDLYVGSHIGLVSLNPSNGSENWVFDSFIEESVPAVDANGNIYFGAVDGTFHIVSPSGEALKEFSLGDNIVNSPTIADDGTVYVAAMNGSEIVLYKITVENSSGPADSPWPMKGQNRKNTAHAL